MRIFITGASGYIGSAVAREVLAHGHEVVGLARSDAAQQQVEAWGMTAYRGDLTEPASLLDAVAAADAVINCGTAMQPNLDRGTIESRAVEAMLEALAGTGKRFLYTSDQLIYGTTGEQIANEDTPLRPSPFMAWRAQLEQIVLNYVNKDVHAMVVRPVAVYGNGQDKLMPMLVQTASQLGFAFYLGDGSARWSLVHVEDLAVLYRLMLEQAAPATLLVGAAEPAVSMRSLAEVAAEVASVPGQVRSLTIEAAAEIFPPYVPIEGLATNLQVSGQRARELLGWQPQQPTLAEEARQGRYAHLQAESVR